MAAASPAHIPSEILFDKAEMNEIFNYFGLVTVVKESQADAPSSKNPEKLLRPATNESYDVMDFMQLMCTSGAGDRRGRSFA